MKTPKVKFSYNYSRGSARYRTVKSRALAERLFHEYLYLYDKKTSIPLKTIVQKFKEFMPEPIYFDIKKLPEAEWDLNAACLNYYIKDDGSLGRYKILVPTDGNSLLLEDLPNLVHEATHLFDSLLQPKALQSYKKVFTNPNVKKIEKFYDYYFYNGDEELMAKNTTNSYIRKQTKKFLRNSSIKEKLNILNYYKEKMQSELNAFKMQSDCNENLKRKNIEGDDFWSFEDMDKLYHFEDKIKLLNEMIYKTLLKERYKMQMEKADSPMDKLKIKIDYCLKSLI